ncbi:nucleolar MIF4G domain-containing protein 1 [Anolis carolinensis]|uniref:Nucleolar MIF4G domain-containing protein 1 n=1 Tax=Anolis carolinensis TaxID=28377 RepID=G1KKZ2_ANOCA|nr:PREDICTED: nucleolar MIF4G domain-containing protein 1 [Anolis carolinensis]|eukprot:XP_003221977.1 PREDICTED: nucleolar MIF4G domain-containing protein 1 [Anolis carolinensis]
MKASLSSALGKRSRGRGRQAGKQLHKLGLAVREFVEASVPAGNESSGCLGLSQPRPRGKRRELRREKRKWKRRQRRRLLNGEKMEEKAVIKVERPPPSLPPSSGKKEKKEKKKPRKELLPTTKASLEARKKALLAANEAEEREIRRLERQLGLGKRRKKRRQKGLDETEAAALPRSFALDGLGYVLGAFGPGDAFSGLYESSTEEEEEGGGGGREQEDRGGMAEEEGEESEEEEEEEDGGDAEDLSMEGEASDNDDVEEEEDLSMEGEAPASDDKEDLSMEGEEGEASEDSSVEEGEKKESEDDGGAVNGLQSSGSRTLESSQEILTQSATKYVPPQMRRSEETLNAKKMEELERLKKSMKGLINRLSEPNLASISGQLEELYMTNSRKDMNEVLTDIITSACVTAAVMPSRLVMEHVLLISILHRTVGIEVGAHFLETVVRKFDEVYKSGTEGKECENLLTLIAHLYNFHVVHSLLIFDILKKLVSTFSEKDIELMLLLLKNVGFSLRKDDALALKELITEAQKKANAIGKQFQDQSRVRFMLEIMLALKNNDMRKIPGYDPEPVEKLRKLQRTLIHSSSGKEAQLRVSLESLLSADQVGRWWIVGSSWSGAPMIDSPSDKVQQVLPIGKVSSKILDLARKQRMNTDIRRNIFCILMTSEDFLDAFEKLLKLRLKDQQEREIVHVLIDCCLQEKTYNPFYAYLSAKFCEYERRFQMTFQFSVWDKIRDLGNLSPTTSSNLVNLLAHLLKTKSLSLTVFKVIEFSELDKPKVHFLRQVLSVLLLKTDPEDLNHIFGKLTDNPKLGMLQEGLKLFLTHFLLKSVQSHRSVEEATVLRERIELVSKTLKAKESRVKL